MTGDEDLIDNMLSDSVEQAIYTYHLFIVFEVPRSLSFISDQGQGNSQQEVQKKGERGVILKLSDNMVSFCFIYFLSHIYPVVFALSILLHLIHHIRIVY